MKAIVLAFVFFALGFSVTWGTRAKRQVEGRIEVINVDTSRPNSASTAAKQAAEPSPPKFAVGTSVSAVESMKGILPEDPSDLDKKMWKSRPHYDLQRYLSDRIVKRVNGKPKCPIPDYNTTAKVEMRGDVASSGKEVVFRPTTVKVVDGPALPDESINCILKKVSRGLVTTAKNEDFPEFNGSIRVVVDMFCGKS